MTWILESSTATSPHFSFDSNWALVNRDSFALSLDPTVVGMFDRTGGASTLFLLAWLPVLLDVISTDTFALTVGIKPGILTSVTLSDSAGTFPTVALLGFSLGAKFMVAENFGFLPEISAARGINDPVLTMSASLGLIF